MIDTSRFRLRVTLTTGLAARRFSNSMTAPSEIRHRGRLVPLLEISNPRRVPSLKKPRILAGLQRHRLANSGCVRYLVVDESAMSHPLTTSYRAKLAFHHSNGFPAVQPQDTGTANRLDVPARLKYVQNAPKWHAEFVGNHAGGS